MKSPIISIAIAVCLCGITCIPQVSKATTYGAIAVNGTKASLSCSSAEMRSYDASNAAFFEDDGITYRFSVNSGYTLSSAYLYFGDGTGQFVSPNTNYTHVVGLHVNFVPSLVLVFSDHSVEELLCPQMWEAWPSSEATPTGRPSSFSPPTVTGTPPADIVSINNALSNNGTSVVTATQVNCLCGHTTDNCAETALDQDECGHTVH
jgi:hypothetical protein